MQSTPSTQTSLLITMLVSVLFISSVLILSTWIVGQYDNISDLVFSTERELTILASKTLYIH